MKYLVVLSSFVCMLQTGLSRPSYSGDYSGYSGADYGSSYGLDAYAPVGYHGPLAKPVVLKSGHLADTPEVAAAKHQHYAALASAAAHGYSGVYDGYGQDSGSYGYGGGYGSSYGYSDYGSGKYAPVGYHGPLAKTVVLKNGHIADTPEVAAAKHLHYAAVEKAKAAHGYSGGYDDSYGSGLGYGSYGSDGYASYGSEGYGSYGSGGYASSYKYSGPLAYPKVLPSGQLADTHEVAAARHAHLKAVAITASEHAQKWANNYH